MGIIYIQNWNIDTLMATNSFKFLLNYWGHLHKRVPGRQTGICKLILLQLLTQRPSEVTLDYIFHVIINLKHQTLFHTEQNITLGKSQ